LCFIAPTGSILFSVCYSRWWKGGVWCRMIEQIVDCDPSTNHVHSLPDPSILKQLLFQHLDRFCIHTVTCLTECHRFFVTLLSILGNRNTSMDTLTTPLLLVTIATKSRKASVGRIATNSGKASVFHRAIRVLYREDNTQWSVSFRQPVSGIKSRLVAGVRVSE
jgi:hypothetical protein